MAFWNNKQQWIHQKEYFSTYKVFYMESLKTIEKDKYGTAYIF